MLKKHKQGHKPWRSEGRRRREEGGEKKTEGSRIDHFIFCTLDECREIDTKIGDFSYTYKTCFQIQYEQLEQAFGIRNHSLYQIYVAI